MCKGGSTACGAEAGAGSEGQGTTCKVCLLSRSQQGLLGPRALRSEVFRQREVWKRIRGLMARNKTQ